MTRRRWIQQLNGELVEVSNDYIGILRTNTDAVLWNDRQYQDVGDARFASRTQHREYMKKNNLSLADDWTQSWAKAEKKRDAHYTTAPDASRHQDMVDAFVKHNKGK